MARGSESRRSGGELKKTVIDPNSREQTIDVTGGEDVPFSQFNMDPNLLKGLTEANYLRCSPIQQEVIPKVLSGNDVLARAKNGTGKCLARDTPVLMASGQFKMVQDIEKGERLMGDDNTPRNVLSTATGREEMARVTLSKGASFTCNVSHVLSLKLSDPIEKGHEATFLCRFHVIVRDSEGLVTEIRSCSKSFEAVDDRDRFFDALHESAVFEGKEVVRSGDVLDVTVRTLLDRECVAAAVYDRLLSFHSSAVDFVEPVVSEHSGDGVSDSVKYGSRRERLEFLASVVDADGVLVADAFEITLQDEELVADVSFIACSLGFLVTRKHGMLSVSGHIDTIPTRDPTKQASLSDQQSGHLCEAFTLELLPEDDYFGFTLDGNARFIVSEDFIVTHNTGAFLVPALMKIRRLDACQVVIVSPKRELAQQTANLARDFCKYLPWLRVVDVVGQFRSVRQDINEFRRGCHMLVGTPGRLLDHIANGNIDLSRVSLLCVDEADELLSYESFIPIIEALPASRQTVALSVTLPMEFKDFVAHHMNANLVKINKMKELTLMGTTHYVTKLEEEKKFKWLLKNVIRGLRFDQVFVFVENVQRCMELAEALAEKVPQLRSGALHGRMGQVERTEVFEAFRNGEIDLLVTTDLGARGLDCQHVNVVVNFDIPSSTESYLHRVGRAGRWGHKSVAISMVAESNREHRRNILMICSELKIQMSPMPKHVSRSLYMR